MSVLIVGSDKVDGLKRAIFSRGLGPVDHWDGRKVAHLRRSIPKSTELVIVVWHHISHALLRKVREDADRRGIPVLYTRYPSGSPADAVSRGDDVVELAARWLAPRAGASLSASA